MECMDCDVGEQDKILLCRNCDALPGRSRLEVVKCLNCGGDNSAQNRFCKWCGLQIVAPNTKLWEQQIRPAQT